MKPITTVPVKLDGGRGYDIRIGAGLVDALPAAVREIAPGARALLVTDKNIADLHLAGVEMKFRRAGVSLHTAVIPPGERSKTLTQYVNLLKRLTEIDDARGVIIVAFGGGVAGDLAGFAAATYKRGIPFIQVPTTLLACVDSSVGGKTGIDLPAGKNLAGAFHQPRLVVMDLELLRTLPPRELRAGYAEVVKTALIFDKKFFEFLEAELGALLEAAPAAMARAVARCCELKARTVERDEFDKKGIRAVLNFGHTFGHAAEAALGYGRLRHGEAVAAGMLCAADMSARRGFISEAVVERIHEHIAAAGLPVQFKGCSVDAIYSRMKLDKKFSSGKMRVVLLERIGKAVVADDATPAEIKAAIKGRVAV